MTASQVPLNASDDGVDGKEVRDRFERFTHLRHVFDGAVPALIAVLVGFASVLAAVALRGGSLVLAITIVVLLSAVVSLAGHLVWKMLRDEA